MKRLDIVRELLASQEPKGACPLPVARIVWLVLADDEQEALRNVSAMSGDLSLRTLTELRWCGLFEPNDLALTNAGRCVLAAGQLK